MQSMDGTLLSAVGGDSNSAIRTAERQEHSYMAAQSSCCHSPPQSQQQTSVNSIQAQQQPQLLSPSGSSSSKHLLDSADFYKPKICEGCDTVITDLYIMKVSRHVESL